MAESYIDKLAAQEAARQYNNQIKQAEMARVMNQGQGGLYDRAIAPMDYNEGMSAEDRYKMELAMRAQQANEQRARAQYAQDNATMQGANVTNGRIDPAYWEAAQRASDYEMSGLAGRAR